MGQGSSASGGKGGNSATAWETDDEDLRKESGLSPYFYDSIKLLFREKSEGGKGVTVATFLEIFQGNMKMNVELRNFLVAVFRAYDRDRNKYLSFREAITMLDTVMNGNVNDRIMGIFRMCDRNDDNLIDEDELTDFMQTLGCIGARGETPVQRKESLRQLAEDVFNKFDKDRDGQLTKVEFFNGCKTHRRMLEEVKRVTDICIKP